MFADDATMTGLPTWFGPEAAPLFGVLHLPSGGVARGGIVICPPVGKEHVDTYRGLKLLAQNLCHAGFVVLRFDYLGTGDSAMSQQSDAAISDWYGSIETAVHYLRDIGVTEIGVIGLRLGALLAARLLPSLGQIAGLVLWDPVTDGRRYLREQRVLYKMTVGEDVVDVASESILGISFSAAAASALKSAKLPDTCAGAKQVLVLVRRERRDDVRLTEFTAAANCDVVDVVGQPEFVEPASFVVEIPAEAVSTITRWLDQAMPRDLHPVAPLVRREAVVAGWGTNRPVVETIDELGPNHLFSIRTVAVDVAENPPTLLIHNTACDHRVGSGRVWTESARELAALGLAVVRYDRRGTGDTGVATTDFARIHSSMAKADVLAAMVATGARPERLIMTGVCSGAWNSAYGAMQLGAKCVVLVNIVLFALRRVEVGPERLIGMTPASPVGGEIAQPRGVGRRTKDLVRRWLPYWAWLTLGRLGIAQVPEVLVGRLVSKHVHTDMVLSPRDHEWFVKQRGPKSVARLRGAGHPPTVHTAPTGDHSLLQRDIQNLVRQHLSDAVSREFANQLSGPVPAEGAEHAAEVFDRGLWGG